MKKTSLLLLLFLLAFLLTGCTTEPNTTNPGFKGDDSFYPVLVPKITATPVPTAQPTAVPTLVPTMVPTMVPVTATPTHGLVVMPTSYNGGYIVPQVVTYPPVTMQPYITPTPPTFSSLREGSTGDSVRSLQQKLKTLGFLKGSVDGDFGTSTKQAVIDFQMMYHLTADGIAGVATLDALMNARTTALPPATPTPSINNHTYLKLGDNGADVRSLQERLIALGYLSGSPNGAFEQLTQMAVIAFQDDTMPYSDGIAGPMTLNALYAPNAPRSYNPVGVIGFSSFTEESQDTQSVRQIQQRLKELGYYHGSVDGDFGSGTLAAVETFQRFNNLTVDGKAGQGTLSVLFSQDATPFSSYNFGTPIPTESSVSYFTKPPYYVEVTPGPSWADYETLRIGTSGELVKKLQSALTSQGYYNEYIDGKFGVSTAEAVVAFQKDKGLQQDGLAGPATLRILYEGDFPKES